VAVRSTVTVGIRLETSAQQLNAVASLLEAIGDERWEHLARAFGRMDAARAVVAPPMAAMLEQLAHQLRQAGQERAALVAADGSGL
jgi:ubiquinone biosynthesis protein UbiJ